MSDAIQVRDVSKSFGETTAVRDISFDVARGEVMGFLGPNGSGKTTTNRLLTSFYTPDSGTILIEGIDNQQDDIATRRMIGYLPENNPLYGDLLVTEYLKFVAGVRGMTAQEYRANLDQVIEETGLEDVFYRPISQLSKGYRQRVGLAQAILHQPDILVLDEPTEGLDPNQRVTIREVIKSLGAERTVLLSTHVLPEVEIMCDRIILISRGKIVARGSVEELRNQALATNEVHVEIQGDGVEAALKEMDKVGDVEPGEPVDGRQKYTVSVVGEEDLRPEIFKLAAERGWVLWDLHKEGGRLEDLFRAMTVQVEGSIEPEEDAEPTILDDGEGVAAE